MGFRIGWKDAGVNGKGGEERGKDENKIGEKGDGI